MKQAIYLFSLYIGAVTFYTLTYFGQNMIFSLAIASLAILGTGIIVYVAGRKEEKVRRFNL